MRYVQFCDIKVKCKIWKRQGKGLDFLGSVQFSVQSFNLFRKNGFELALNWLGKGAISSVCMLF